MDLSEYPKTCHLKDGTEVTLRPLVADDKFNLLKFFRDLPEKDRLFLKEDVTEKEVINRWIDHLDYDQVLPILAEMNGEIIADGTLHMNKYGWSRHVGEIRIAVAESYQTRGLGSVLAHELVGHAQKIGLEKVQAQVIESEVGAIVMLERIGFEIGAVLKDYVTDTKGGKQNLVIMINDVMELWRKMEDLIHDSEWHMKV
jgi:ribosomal protein S18 acetylase RimI-like enzyme